MDGLDVSGVDSAGVVIPQVFSQGHPLIHVWNEALGTLQAVWEDQPDHVVFQFVIDPVTGEYELTSLDQLDHPLTNDPSAPDATGFEDNITVTLTYTVTENAAPFQATDGTVSINFDDDMPKVIGEGISVEVDEDDLHTAWSQGTSPDGDTEGATGAALVTGTLSGVVDIGADEHPGFDNEGQNEGQKPIYGFTDDIIEQMEALHLHSKQEVQPATEDGQELFYTTFTDPVDSAWIVLRAFEPDPDVGPGTGENPDLGDTGNPVFELRLNQYTGEYEFRLFDELIHVLPDWTTSRMARTKTTPCAPRAWKRSISAPSSRSRTTMATPSRSPAASKSRSRTTSRTPTST